MKLTAIILLAACLQLSARGVSQTLTITLKNASLEKVFAEIQKQTGYSFFYEDGLLKNAKPVDIVVVKASIAQVLDMCFANQPFTYKIVNNAISVRRKEQIVEASFKPETGDPVTVSGRVTDPQGNPLVGANVKVKGSNVGTTTDNLGRFSLSNIDPDAILEISFVGHDAQTFSIKGKSFLTIALVQKQSILDETVVIAYGTSSRRFTTGNIATVKAADIEKQPVQNPLLALQGRVPGVEITQLTGLPGGGVTVRIQGRNSLRPDALEPLIIIDGVPFPSQLTNSVYSESIVQNGSPLNYINPADIESVDILKDADATAIYGSQAANGAILITTKKGKAGRTKVNLNLQQGWGKVARRVDMLNTEQYLAMRWEAFRNSALIPSSNPSAISPFVYAPDLLFWDTTRYTDWQKELIGGTAQFTSINAGISGGTTSVQYLVGGTFNRQTTVFPGEFDDKVGSLHFNINGASANQRLKVQLTGSYTYDQNHLPGVDLTQQAILMEPNAPPLFDGNGTLNWAQNSSGNSTFINPLANTRNSDFNNSTKNLVANIVLGYRILPGLDFRTSLGYSNTQTNLYKPYRLDRVQPERRANTQRIATFVNRNMVSWIIEPQLQYSGNIGKGKIDGLLGTTIRKSNNDYLGVVGQGFSTDLLMKTLNAATSIIIDLSNSSTSRFNAMFGRLNYNWDNKYIINFTARRDGSNKFGDKNKFHNFGSVGLGWIFSQEKLVQQLLPILSFGKVRASYGTTGNDQIPDFKYLGIYEINTPSVFYQNNLGLNATGIPNPHLQWEETRKMQVGFDLGFLNDRLVLGGTYSRNRSSNQLVGYVLPTLTGSNVITKNLPALIQNSSWEFLLNSVQIKGRNFTWSSSINFTIPRNKLVKFPGIELTSYALGNNGVIVGQPIGVLKLAPFVGINPANGAYLIMDINGNPAPLAAFEDQRILVSPISTHYGGLENNITYKGFQLDFLLQFIRKRGPRDMFFYGSLYPGQFFQGSSNQPVTVMDRWQKPGDNRIIGPFSTSSLSQSFTNTDMYYSYEASYIRLKNISLSWQFPDTYTKKLGLQNVRIYAHAQNLLTITKYRGLDPETMSIGTLPPLRMITIGGQIEF